MFKLLAALCISLFVSPLALAQDFLVKVSSQVCQQAKTLRQGSGNLIQIEGKTFILSSDHVVYHGNKESRICHKAFLQGRSYNLRLEAVQAFKGIALLSLEESIPAALLSKASPLDEPLHTHKLEGSFLRLAGFPAMSNSVVISENAQVLNTKSNRKILPEISSVIEVKGHSEFGMSGGALVDKSGKFAGLLSHQYLRMHLGAPSTLHNYGEESGGGEMIALVIPQSEIVAWVKAWLRNNKEDIRLDVKSQISRKDSIVLHGVRFTTESCNTNEGGVGGRGGDGAGIGGRNQGGDGAGIGGGSHAEEKICSIRVEASAEEGSSVSQVAKSQWFRQLQEKIQSGSQARITGLFRDGVRYDLIGLVAFFAQTARQMMPLIELKNPFVAEPAVLQRLQKLATAALSDLKRLQAQSLEAEAYEHLQSVEIFLQALQKGQWDLLSSQELEYLLAADAWTFLMQIEFESSVSLKGKLLQAQEEIRRIRL